MALARWQATIVDLEGDVQPAASIEVRREVGGAPLASLYSDRDGVTPLGNPFQADGNGFAGFHAAGGAYRITATLGAFSRTWRYVALGTMAEIDVGSLDLSNFNISNAVVVATGSAQSRTLANRAADVINVLDYGADPTGGAPSTQAFQDAAAAYASGNKEFWCPDGFYTIDEQIVFELSTGVVSRNEPPASLRFGANAHIRATASIAGAMIVWGGTGYDNLIENGAAYGGLFDCNDFADIGFDVPFCNNVMLFGMQVRNHNDYGFRLGRTASSARSYGALLDQCQTERYGMQRGITGITKANPGVVTLASAPDKPLVNGDKVTIDSVGGMTQVNDKTFTITAISPTTFSIGVNTTGYGTYTSGGNAYTGFSPTGSCGIYYENCGDSHATNCTLTGNQIGVSSNDGVYDGKFTNNHVWNFLFHGELSYGFDVAGDNQFVGCQVDGPFHYAFRVSGQRNNFLGCQTTYEGETYGGQDNYAYPLRIETGGGATAVACSWKAMSAGARLAGEISGDGANFISYANLSQNMVVPPVGEFHRRDLNGDLDFTRQNSSSGASATVVDRRTTNAGTLFNIARSTAGGGSATMDWTGAGNLFFSAGNAGARIEFQTAYSTRLTVEATGGVFASSAVGGLGYATGAGGSVTQATSKSTGVTLNRPSGRITMHNATLNAGASVSFTLTNDQIANTDTVSIAHSSQAGTVGAYRAVCKSVSNGSCNIEVTNTSGGNLGEALTLQFNVHKGAIS